MDGVSGSTKPQKIHFDVDRAVGAKSKTFEMHGLKGDPSADALADAGAAAEHLARIGGINAVFGEEPGEGFRVAALVCECYAVVKRESDRLLTQKFAG